jgi:benzoylformate decarboxylase
MVSLPSLHSPSQSPDQPRVSVCSAVFKLLRAFGMKTIFGNPGSTELPMFRAFPSDFRYILGLQESIVVGMADGFAQATRNAALVNLHSAAGLGHALGNVFTAFRNQTPLVITAGQQARSILPFQPFLFAEQATEFPKPYIKWSCEPARAEDVPAAIARAYYTAMQPPRGPTFVSIPVDDWERDCVAIEPREVSSVIVGDLGLLGQVSHALNAARAPAFVVGAGVAREGVWDELISLAELHQALVWVSPMSARNSFPEDHELFAGFLPANRGGIVTALAGHDVIVVMGAPVFTYHVEGFGPHAPPGAQLFQLTDDPVSATSCAVGVSVVTSLVPGVRELLRGGGGSGARPPPPKFERQPLLAMGALTDSYLLQQVTALRPPESIIVEEAPSSRSAMHERLPMVNRDSFYTCASGGLGHGLPAALGVALARPDKKVIAILGDGASLYAIQGLATAGQLNLPVAFIVLNNRRYKALEEFGRHFGLADTIGTSLPNVDFCAIARAQGCDAIRVRKPADLDAALQAAFGASVPTLVEVEID